MINELDRVFDGDGSYLGNFVQAVRRLGHRIPSDEDLNPLIIFDDGNTRIYYAPFDWVNENARVVVVGITPGHHTMLSGIRELANALREGASVQDSLRLAKRAASFSNMRRNLTTMLDEIGVNDALGLRSCGDLFDGRADLLHATSCIRYPVLIRTGSGWGNYTGHSPKLVEWSVGCRFTDGFLAEELRHFPNALIVPNGDAVASALGRLSSSRVIDTENCLFGFPHASPANGHRCASLRFTETK